MLNKTLFGIHISPIDIKIEYYKSSVFLVKFIDRNTDKPIAKEDLIDDINTILINARNLKYINNSKSFAVHIDDIGVIKTLLDKVSRYIYRVDDVDYLIMILKKINPLNKQKRIQIENYIDNNYKRILPEKLHESIFPYQLESLKFYAANRGRMLLADEPGLGKTIQIIAITLFFKYKSILIICPSSLKKMWKNEYKKWSNIEDNEIQLLTNKNEEFKKVNIGSYNLFTKNNIDRYINHDFSIIICDESHYIKEFKSQRTQIIVPLIKKVKNCILASGTPIMSRPKEIYTQINALFPSIFNNFITFGRRYCDPKPGYRGVMNYNGSSNHNELHSLLSDIVMLRRTKDVIKNQMPKKSRTIVYIDLPPEQQEKIKNIDEDLNIFQLFKKVSQIKIQNILQRIEEYINCGEKIIIFAHHKRIIEEIENITKSQNVNYILIDGRTKQNIRQNYVDDFQNNPDCKVAILSLNAAGTGLTLNKASKVLFVELYWNPSTILQAENRAYRYGQVNDVEVIYLITKNTVEHIIWFIINQKLENVSAMTDGKIDKFNYNKTNHITIEDIVKYNSVTKKRKFSNTLLP